MNGTEIKVVQDPQQNQMATYERPLENAMAGDGTLFACHLMHFGMYKHGESGTHEHEHHH